MLFACGTAQAQTQKITGDVVRLDAASLQLKATNGQLIAVAFGDKTRLSARSPATLAQIASGAYVGTTAVPQSDGTLLASEVHIFPEAMRGTGEGHRPMDAPGNTMTNATVSQVVADAPPRNTMTNATVASVAGSSAAHRLTLTYPGGEKVVVVPPQTPIVMVETANRARLTPGAHVIVYASRLPDGSLNADRVIIGTNGFTPPM
ncbi:MAG: DUF5666 domain-containing protein [Casimicrobiaceae bacterium]